ncbi:hypothetical protein MalM14_07370 [Gimesia chilikensis]|nr:hypothetical protein MalM14_07370 [Gimesia chilikensis]
MKFRFHCRLLFLNMTLMLIPAFSSSSQAGEDVLFQMARSILKNESDPADDSLSVARSQYLKFVAKQRDEKETASLLEIWPADSLTEAEIRLSHCWRNRLYWAGLQYAPRSELPLSRKLTSLVGHNKVPPEKVITQLLAQEQKPIASLDQSMVALLRFSARYDQALQSKDPQAELQKLEPDVQALVPHALQLLEKKYPAKGYYHFTWHPVKAEVAQCLFAMLTIVPAEQRSPELRQLSGQIDKAFGLGCAHRGWYAAYERGVELLARQDAGLALRVWQSDFLENPEVLTSVSRLLSPENRTAFPEFARFVSGTKSLLELLRKTPDPSEQADLLALLEHEDSELWRFCLFLTLETARLRQDRQLLQLASKKLLEQSGRLYDPQQEEAFNMINDLNCLYYSAFRAAQQVNNQKLQHELLSRMILLYPRVGESFFNILDERHIQKQDWLYLFHQRDPASDWLWEYTVMLQEEVEEFGSGIYEAGVLWATTGSTRLGEESIQIIFKHQFKRQCFAWGAGYSVGKGSAPLAVGATWLQLSHLDPEFNQPDCFVEYCAGYAEGRQKLTDNWDARFLRVLDAAR